MLAEAKAQTGLPVVTELMDVRDLDAVLEVADVVQIGARNMQNYTLLADDEIVVWREDNLRHFEHSFPV